MAKLTTNELNSITIGQFYRRDLQLPQTVESRLVIRNSVVILRFIARTKLEIEVHWHPTDGQPWGRQIPPIRVDWTTPNYGGQRPWFTCPECERRSGRLFYSNRLMFMCLKCGNLAYPSQRQSEQLRRRNRAAALRDKLEWSMGSPIPNKPAGMHWSTYDRIVEEIMAIEREDYAATLHRGALFARLLREKWANEILRKT